MTLTLDFLGPRCRPGGLRLRIETVPASRGLKKHTQSDAFPSSREDIFPSICGHRESHIGLKHWLEGIRFFRAKVPKSP